MAFALLAVQERNVIYDIQLKTRLTLEIRHHFLNCPLNNNHFLSYWIDTFGVAADIDGFSVVDLSEDESVTGRA